jgi:hypothetical protein
MQSFRSTRGHLRYVSAAYSVRNACMQCLFVARNGITAINLLADSVELCIIRVSTYSDGLSTTENVPGNVDLSSLTNTTQ